MLIQNIPEEVFLMKGKIKIDLNKVSFNFNHDEILNIVSQLMKKSEDYKVIKKKYDPPRELKNLKLEWYCGEIDILALDKYGTAEIIEVKSNGFPLFEARNQLMKRNEWIIDNKDIVEKYIFGCSFKRVDNIVCYQTSGYIIFHDIDVYDKYWDNKNNEYLIPDEVQYKRMKLGSYTIPKESVRKVLRRINLYH